MHEGTESAVSDLFLRRRALGVAAAACVVVLCVAIPSAARAAQGAAGLDSVEALTERGEIVEARRVLQRWLSDSGGGASPAQRARASFLQGRLSEEGAEAEFHYLRVVIDGSSSPYADDALLRLGQYRLAEGNPAKAIEYLGRLRRDYPTSEHGAAALLWITRAAVALGDRERACAAAAQGLREAPPNDSSLVRLLREARAGCQAPSGAYAVQVAALRDAAAAQSLANDLLAEGFDAWILNASPGDPFYRVRVGRGLSEAQADALADRLVQAGYSPFLVSEVENVRGGE